MTTTIVEIGLSTHPTLSATRKSLSNTKVGNRRDREAFDRTDSNLEDAQQLWLRFWATNDQDLRNDLIEKNLYLVDKVVRRLPYRVLQHSSADDLRSFGTFGLINAVERHHSDGGQIGFANYAESRIRGAIYDSPL